MDAENLVVGCFVVDNGCEWHLLKHIVDALENAVGVIYVLTKTTSAFLSESEVSVYISIFVVPAQHEHLFRVLQFKSHQKTDNFQALSSLVNVVSKEKVVVAADVTVFARTSPDVEESHQINVVTMDVTKNFNWWLQSFDKNWLLL